MRSSMIGLWILLCPALALIVGATPVEKCQNKQPLDDLIQHYEPVHYDLEDFGHRHRRAVDTVGVSDEHQEINIKFHAHGRPFHLRLKPDTSDLAAHTEFHIHTANGLQKDLDYNPNSFLKGRVEDDEGSFVTAFNDEGVMSANIHCSHGSYYLKPAHQHFKELQAFHSVMYRTTDISPLPVSMLKNATLREKIEKQPFCGAAHSEQVGDVLEEGRQQREAHFQRAKEERSSSNSRSKRDSTKRRFSKFVCTVALYADYHFVQGRAGGDKNRAIMIMRQHVSSANNIFAVSDFDKNGEADGFLFKIGHITVVEDDNVEPFAGRTADLHQPGAHGNTVSKVIDHRWLTIFSSFEYHKDFCEAFHFTYLDFPEGVLGLAFLPPGGICSKPMNIAAKDVFTYRGKTYSRSTRNTGFITFINYGVQQNDGITEIVFAHEAGHNWGSSHDTKTLNCVPGGSDGNYLMFNQATDGTKGNNAKFSPCSLSQINTNVKRFEKSECFSDNPSAFCGNSIVEMGEECDCGTTECKDPCCNKFNPTNKDGNCKVNKTAGYDCSPLSGECCNKNCRFVGGSTTAGAGPTMGPMDAGMTPTANTTGNTTANITGNITDNSTGPTMEAATVEVTTDTATDEEGSDGAAAGGGGAQRQVGVPMQIMCGSPDSCQQQPYCTAMQAACPTPINVADNTLCTPKGVSKNSTRQFRQACLNGHCGESACAAAGYKQCSCGAKSCQVCCLVGRQCVNSHTKPITGNGVSLADYYLAPGAACNNYQGRCDLNGVCQVIDLETSLNGLNNLFSSETLDVIAMWLKNNWFWVLVIIIVVIGLAVAVHFTYKWKQKHEWKDGKKLAKTATSRIGKSLRGPRSQRGGRGGDESADQYQSRTCARRMTKMFPKAGYEVLLQAAQSCDNEESAVIKVLDMGHKMTKW